MVSTQWFNNVKILPTKEQKIKSNCLSPIHAYLFMPSVPKNGTPTLMVNREIIQALMG